MKQLGLSIVGIVLCCLGFGVNSGIAQSVPLKVGDITYKKIKPGATENWLNEISIEAENTSGKTIAFAQITVEFTAPQAPKELSAITLQYGGLDTGIFAAASAKPGEKIKLTLPKSACNSRIDASLVKSGYVPASSKEMTVTLGKVIFADKIGWADGRLFNPDPKNSRRWLVAGDDSAAASLSKLYQTSKGASFIPASFITKEKASACGTYVGYEILTDCCPDLIVFSDLVDYDQPGNATVRAISDHCPGSTQICTTYLVRSCH
jgi:hypothetical protein